MTRNVADAPPLSREELAAAPAEAAGSTPATWRAVSIWAPVLLLMAIGFVMIYSASAVMASAKFGDPSYYVKRQALYMVAGLLLIWGVSRIPYRRFAENSRLLLLLSVISLVLVLIPGVGAEINSARRWFQLPLVNLQPAEFAKVIWVVFLASSMAKRGERVRKLGGGFVTYMVIFGVVAFLILREPDFGTVAVLGMVTAVMLVAGGVPWRYLLILLPVAAGGVYRFVYRVPWRWERIKAFLDPFTDPLDTGYHLIQSWIAVGSGGLFGVGLGMGRQKLFYLPEPYTDFILAVLAEELGFIGLVAVAFLFVLLFLAGMRVSGEAPDAAGALLALGLTMLISLQALINMGVVLGLFPTKGLPLPFVSYGGSAFMANCLAVGILLNIAKAATRRIT